MGYKSDAFFNKYNQNEFKTGFERLNPPFFNFPSTKVRGLVTDKTTGQIVYGNTNLTKGYIRTLAMGYTNTGYDFATSKVKLCGFQFNPTTLSQSVDLRQDITNMFLSDPAQFSQPVGGTVQFGFNLIFDRTYTYNNEPDDSNIIDVESGDGWKKTLDPLEKNIGVLADIRALYSVIGQGISAELLEFQKQNALRQARAQQLALAGNGNTDENTDETAPDTSTEKSTSSDSPGITQEQLERFYDPAVNAGNSAFLFPTPVRVVFSSLYMVDGYVTSSSIEYTKFSSTLVPLQCTVTLMMEALYIGFAKDITPLTYNYQLSSETLQEDVDRRNETAPQVFQTLLDGLKKTRFSLAYSPEAKGPRQPTAAYELTIEEWLGNRDGRSPDQININIDIRKDQAKVIEAQFGQSSISITMENSIKAYGPFMNTITDDNVKNSEYTVPDKLLQTYYSTTTISDWDAFNQMRKGLKVGAERTQNEELDFSYDSNYFIITGEFALTIQIDGYRYKRYFVGKGYRYFQGGGNVYSIFKNLVFSF